MDGVFAGVAADVWGVADAVADAVDVTDVLDVLDVAGVAEVVLAGAALYHAFGSINNSRIMITPRIPSKQWSTCLPLKGARSKPMCISSPPHVIGLPLYDDIKGYSNSNSSSHCCYTLPM